MSFESDLAKVRKRAEEQGWRVVKSHHWWLFFWPGMEPDEKPCTIGGTGHSRGRALLNLLACLKRHGYRQ